MRCSRKCLSVILNVLCSIMVYTLFWLAVVLGTWGDLDFYHINSFAWMDNHRIAPWCLDDSKIIFMTLHRVACCCLHLLIPSFIIVIISHNLLCFFSNYLNAHYASYDFIPYFFFMETHLDFLHSPPLSLGHFDCDMNYGCGSFYYIFVCVIFFLIVFDTLLNFISFRLIY